MASLRLSTPKAISAHGTAMAKLSTTQRVSQQAVSQFVRHNHARAYQWSTHVKSPRDQERMRPFHASPQMDESPPVDFAFMPQHTLEASMPPEIMRIPLLPHNSSPSRSAEVAEEVIEPVVRPQISTVSADSTHIESPSSMVEVVDNHAVDLDPYDLTRKVAASASRTAEVPVNEGTEPSSLRDLWNGLLDRVSGSRKLAKAS